MLALFLLGKKVHVHAASSRGQGLNRGDVFVCCKSEKIQNSQLYETPSKYKITKKILEIKNEQTFALY